MNLYSNLKHDDYEKILINHLDRLLDFYVILYAANTEKEELKTCLDKSRHLILLDLYDRGITQNDIDRFNIETEAYDIFQMNYSYSRELENTLLKNGSHEEREKYRNISAAIYSLNSGNDINITIDDPGFIKNDSAFSIGYKEAFIFNKIIFPCLHQIRVSDILRSPSIDELTPLISNAIKSNLRVKRNNTSTIDENAITDLSKLTEFYPERLFLGLRYIFLGNDSTSNYSELAFSLHHLTSSDDIAPALRDIQFQHEKFKSYYHHHKCQSLDTLQFHRLKTLASLPSRDNKYIKQLNSVENSFLALSAWKKINFDGMARTDAINDVINNIINDSTTNENERSRLQSADFKKKIRDRLTSINKYIELQRQHQETLSEKFRIMHPEYYSKEFLAPFTTDY